MNGEIRFRAWDKFEKKMFYDVQNIYDDRLISANSFAAVLSSPEIYDVSQFTGLKDKNGKEIWEGDIFSIPEPIKNGGVKWENINRPVEFSDGSFRVQWCNGKIPISEINKNRLEVIGNIFENTELIPK